MIGYARVKDNKGKWTGKFYKYFFDMQTNTEKVLKSNVYFSEAYLDWSSNTMYDTLHNDFFNYSVTRKVRVPYAS